jgi:hypothetical protein
VDLERRCPGSRPGGELLRQGRLAASQTDEHDAGREPGFDTVGLENLTRDRVPDFVVSAATGERVYVIAGAKR